MNIPINDLRVNNLVWNEAQNPSLVTRISSSDIDSEIVLQQLNVRTHELTYKITDVVYPIPALNELSLSALGFCQPIYEAYWSLDCQHDMHLLLRPNDYDSVYFKPPNFREVFPIPINGAHSIQNIYYVLIGVELPIRL